MQNILNQNQKSILKGLNVVWTMSDQMVSMINGDYFILKGLEANHGKQLIDIRLQDPTHDSFFTQKSNQELIGLNISDYIQYITDPKTFLEKHAITQNMVLFAANINMNNWDKEIQHLFTHIPKSLQPLEGQNGLCYPRQQIQGVNIPELFIQVEGAWTGGQQANLSINVINLNHGPGECLWITVDAKYVQQLRSKVLQIHQIDILKQAGVWFKGLDWFLENDIPVKSTIQKKKRELIILGAGCLYWVKSLGITINTAWNILSLQAITFDQMKLRDTINREINYRTAIPYKSLMLDIYIHKSQLPQFIIVGMREQLMDFLNEEYLTLCSKGYIPSHVKGSLKKVHLCSNCGKDIFLYYYKDNDSYVYCVWCIPPGIKEISSKYEYRHILLLTLMYPEECCILWCAPYIGRTKCSSQHKLKELDMSEQVQTNEKKRQNEPQKLVRNVKKDDNDEPPLNKKNKN